MINLYVRLQAALAAAKNESGQDLIEYALLGALISVATIAVMTPLATKISATFTAITTAL